MLRLRISSPIRVVCMGDPALDDVPMSARSEYEATRNIDDLRLEEFGAKPTIFTCDPLQTNFESLCDVPTSDNLWSLFAYHCTAIDNLTDEAGADYNANSLFITKEGRRHVDPEARDKFPRDVYTEVATIIAQRANGRDGDAIPFASMSQDTWQRDTIRRRALRAVREKRNAPTEKTAEPTDSE